jgi:hypothetical protein
MDDTGLWFTATPSRTLTRQKRQKGVKKHSTRITLALCSNATGTHKLMPLLIGKAKKPRCFTKAFKHARHVMYRNQKNAWMCTSIFDEWLFGFHRWARMTNKQVVLLLDNAACHQVLDGRHVQHWPQHPTATTVKPEMVDGLVTWKLTNMRVVFLPPNTTSEVQPLDQGIICSFKARYRAKLLTWMLAEKGKPGNENLDLAKLKPNLRQSIKWISTIWTEFPESIIVNCWRRSGLLPQQGQGVETSPAPELEQDTQDLQDLIDATNLGEDALNA